MIFDMVPMYLRETQGADLPDDWRWVRCVSTFADPLTVRFIGADGAAWHVNIAEYKAWYDDRQQT